MTSFRLAFLACLVAALPALEVASFTLIDADTDQPVSAHDPLVDGATIDFAAIGTSNLNVRANVSGTVGSVVFDLDSGATTQTENQSPYALAGDSNGDYDAWTPSEGAHTLVATPYDGSDGGGAAGTAHSIAFDVVADGGGGTSDPAGTDGSGAITITGERKRWHKLTLEIDGPWAAETGDPNPFLDYRLQVTFTNDSLTYVVPGYFAADGDAANTSANSGTIWRAHLSPDLTGTWTYTVSMRQGANVAISEDPNAGTAVVGIDGATGTFDVAETDKGGRDFRGKGRLEYVGEHHLRFAGSGEWFVKGGADAPENFLGYYEFDQTSDQGGNGPDTPDGLHHYDPHLGDWQGSDPTWQSGEGKRIIGALNYLASTGSNVFSFLTYNSGGDGRDVWPHAAYDDRLRFDCSKLDQWEIVFAHAQRKGLYLHFKTQETENDNGTWGLDGGAVGTERKLYYRELVARYAHHLALNWNLGEENSQTDQQRVDMAQFFYDIDPYHHHIVIHTYPGDHDKVYTPLLGDASKLTGPSIQTGWKNVHKATRTWIANSAAAGKKWVVANDEQGGANTGIRPDYDWPDSNTTLAQNEDQRHQVLWGNLMTGGAGVEAYFGYSLPHSDMTCEDWRSRDDWFRACGHALAFFHDHLPFQEMQGADPLVGNGNHSGNGRYCLAKTGQIYAVYLPDGGPADLDLSGVSGAFEVRWYDPRNGGSLQNGSVTAVAGGATVNLGSPPSATDKDWACLVRLTSGGGNLPPSVNAGPDASVTLPDSLSLSGTASDPDGDDLTTTWSQVSGPGTATFADPSALATTASFDVAGTYVLRLSADDGTDTASDDLTVEVANPTTFRDPDDPSGATGGIAYEEYHTGSLSQLPDFSTMTPVATGVTDAPGVHVRTRDDDFALVFTGYVDVPADDTWTFFTSSDDGSKLFVGSQLVVDNDGTHSKRERSGSIGLKAGLHQIRVEFFERGGGEVLEVRWQGGGTTKSLIPAGSYLHVGGASNAAPLAAASATPTSGTAPLDVAFDASGSSDADGTIQSYAWDFGDGATGSGATPAHTYAAAGSYTATVTVTDDDGATDQASVAIDVTQSTGDLPSPWVAEDVGNVAAAGSTSHSSGTWTVQGSGNDIWNQADEFHFVHQPISGDVTITARVESLTNTHQWAKAGVMIRQSTAADSSHAMCVQTVANGVSFQRRTNAGSGSDHTSGNAETAPSWVRMQRSGATLTASTSEDGSTWTVIGSVDIAMTDPVEVGLCVTAHNDGSLCEAVFTDVVVDGGGASNGAPVADAGANQTIALPNDTASLDGTVADPDGDTLTTTWSLSSGPGTVNFGDPNAVDTTATFSTDGIYVLELAASDGALTSTDTVSITVEPEPTGGEVVLAVNGGGGTYAAIDGTAYEADTGIVSGGKTYSTSAAIGATEDDPVYQAERYGNFSYAATLPDGDYEITFQFAEIYWSGSGKRIFDVAVEGALAIDDLDIYVAAGGKDIAYEVVVPVTIADGVLDVDFITLKDNAKCSGMVVRTATPTSNG